MTEDDGPRDPFKDQQHLGEMLALMVDTMRQLAEAAAGYQKMLITQGFTQEHAQVIALDFLRRMQAKAIPIKEGE